MGFLAAWDVRIMIELEKRLAKFGIKLGLERIGSICEKLGRPHEKMNVILVTGTNGKGSVTAAIASMLTEAGFRTGSYFSPHISRYNERIKVDGKEITDGEFARYEGELLRLHDGGEEMTLFEALTAIAYKYFADMGCDYAVMEIGMGGRYDATNIAMERAAVITNVELEHTEYLGRTVAEIARDKAHIMKSPRAFAVTGCAGEALGEVENRANVLGMELRALNRDFSATVRQATLDGTVFDYAGGRSHSGLFIPLAGRHQAENAALAVAVAEGLGLGADAIRNGLARVRHPGRLEIVCRKPLIVVDAAHNPAGIRTLVASLDLLPQGKPVCVFTALKDKDWGGMLALLAPKCRMMVINQLADARAADSGAMAEEAGRYTKAVVVKDIRESVRLAKAEAGENGVVLICGSIYMLGEAKAAAGED